VRATSVPAYLGSLPIGPFPVGFRAAFLADVARQYPFGSEQRGPRPILMGIWYPSEAADQARRMKLGEYFDLPSHLGDGLPHELRAPGDADALGTDLLAPFAAKLARHLADASAGAHVDAWRASPSLAVRDPRAAAGRFPLVLYHPGLGSSYVDSSVLFELLASWGYVVVSSAYPSATGAYLYIDGDRRTSLADAEHLLRAALRLPYVDRERVASMGHSYGAGAAIRMRQQNDLVRAVVSLDSTLDYDRWLTARDAEHDFVVNERSLGVPMLVVADGTAEFSVLRRVRHADLYLTRFHGFRHDDFISDDVVTLSVTGTHDGAGRVAAYGEVCVAVQRFLDFALCGRGTGVDLSDLACELEHRPGRPAPSPSRFFAWIDAAGVRSALAEARAAWGDEPWLSVSELARIGFQLRERALHREAVELLEHATRCYPDRSTLWDDLARAQQACGDAAGALDAATRWIEAIPTDPAIGPGQQKLDLEEARELVAALEAGRSG
jgi:dienelactone hydrolase